MSTRRFWLLWVLFAIGSVLGLEAPNFDLPVGGLLAGVAAAELIRWGR